MSYLVGTFGKDDSLYPNDPQKRANVDRMLYFDIGTLYKSMIDYFVSTCPSWKFKFLTFLLTPDGLLFKNPVIIDNLFAIVDNSLTILVAF